VFRGPSWPGNKPSATKVSKFKDILIAGVGSWTRILGTNLFWSLIRAHNAWPPKEKFLILVLGHACCFVLPFFPLQAQKFQRFRVTNGLHAPLNYILNGTRRTVSVWKSARNVLTERSTIDRRYCCSRLPIVKFLMRNIVCVWSHSTAKWHSVEANLCAKQASLWKFDSCVAPYK